MPPKSIFKRPGARHFQLVHRSQRDPLIHDPEASQHVLKPIVKGKNRADLERSLATDELAHDLSRANIGEATLYGVYYDDTDYDYMQHLRPVGVQEDGVDSVLIEAPSTSKGKRSVAGKGKAKGEDLVRDIPAEALPSTTELARDYDSQQAIPAALSGLQPDMDPHLRQTLEALEDDAFVDEGLEDDFFKDLVAGGERDDDDEEAEFEFDEYGIEYDAEEEAHFGAEEEEGTEIGEEEDNWEARFAKFKKEKKAQESQEKEGDASSDVASDIRSEGGDTVGNLPEIRVIGGKRRRKGTSDASGYSMSSSSMFQNEGLSLLDERFDQVEKEYASDEDEEEEEDDSDEAPDLITSREDFNSIMDDFLENYEILGGKMRPTLAGDSVTDKLGTIRQSLREIGYEVNGQIDDEKDAEDLFEDYVEEKGDRWDCETILSTYSNLENHPRLIRAKEVKPVPKIILDPKTGLPSTVAAEPKTRTTRRAALPVVAEENVKPQVVTIARPKNETKEEKQIRKQAVKQERQTRRTEKKATKNQFSDEKKRQVQILANAERKGIKKL